MHSVRSNIEGLNGAGWSLQCFAASFKLTQLGLFLTYRGYTGAIETIISRKWPFKIIQGHLFWDKCMEIGQGTIHDTTPCPGKKEARVF